MDVGNSRLLSRGLLGTFCDTTGEMEACNELGDLDLLIAAGKVD